MRSIVAAALLLFTAFPVAAQERVPQPQPQPQGGSAGAGPKNTITINPLGLLFGALGFEYERAVSGGVSFFVGPSYAALTTTTDEASAIGMGLGLRFFTGGAAPEGFFVGPFANVAYASATSKTTTAEASALSYAAGGLLGYTWLVGDVFDISIGIGAQYLAMELEANDGSSLGVSGVFPAARLALGVGF